MTDVDRTEYSEMIEGDRGNYGWQARYDISTSGYLGISQFESGKAKERVLLSPEQVSELKSFIRGR